MSKSITTQQRILDAATQRFSEQNFDAVSVRSIARVADVDQALVHHYFGTKQELFEAVLATAIHPNEILASSLADVSTDNWGEIIIREADALWSSASGTVILAIVRHSIGGNSTMLRSFIDRGIIGIIAPYLPGDEAEQRLRAAAVGSQIVGLMIARYLVKVEPLASLPTSQIVELYSPTLQRYLTGVL